MIARSLQLAALATLLAACARAPESGPAASLESHLARPGLSAAATGGLGGTVVYASLPEAAGRPALLDERRYTDGLRQSIGWRGRRGQELGRVEIDLRDPDVETDRSRGMAKPTKPAILTELGERFPGMAMTVVPSPRRNAHGPYGLAIGRGGDDRRCLYAWQWSSGNRLAGPSGPVSDLSLRARLCRSGATFEELASLVDALVLGPVALTGPSQPVQRSRRDAGDPGRPDPARRHAAARAAASAPVFVPEAAPQAGPRYLAPVGPAAGSSTASSLGAAVSRPGASPVAAEPLASGPAWPRAEGLRSPLLRSGAGMPAPTVVVDLPPEAYSGPAARAPALPGSGPTSTAPR